jgi:hypothetical protein
MSSHVIFAFVWGESRQRGYLKHTRIAFGVFYRLTVSCNSTTLRVWQKRNLKSPGHRVVRFADGLPISVTLSLFKMTVVGFFRQCWWYKYHRCTAFLFTFYGVFSYYKRSIFMTHRRGSCGGFVETKKMQVHAKAQRNARRGRKVKIVQGSRSNV